MSRNFDVLRRADEDKNLMPPPLVSSQHMVGEMQAPPPALPNICFPDGADGRLRDELVKLTQRLFLSPTGLRRVAFSAVEQGAGCSWMVFHVANLLASQVAGSVCVVDANFRAPSLHAHYKTENTAGLADVLRGVPLRDLVRKVGDRNLWLLNCGTIGDHGQAAMASQNVSACLAELQARFDYILLDLPPVTYVEAISLAQSADGLVLVMAESSTRRQAADKAVQELQKAKVRVLGAVFNKRTFPIPQAIYQRL